MKTVYESCIEIVLEDVFNKRRHPAFKDSCHFYQMRKSCSENSQEWSILTRLHRTAEYASSAGSDGYIGSYANCAFSVLYEVFGFDIIGFLINRPWVPYLTVNPFQPKEFLTRVAVLERASRKLRQEDKLPISSPGFELFMLPGMTQLPGKFKKEGHGFFLRDGLRELRDFGEFALTMKRTTKRSKVFVHIHTSAEEYDPPDILKFAVDPEKR